VRLILRILRLAIALPLRAVVCAVGWFACWMELAADWAVGARGATEYVRVGACKRCGRCCTFLGLELPKPFVGRRWLTRLVSAWHDLVMNFESLGEMERVLVYRCRYYREAGGCSIYPFRHRICRFFPRQRLYGHPELHPDCGYRFIRRDVLARRRERAKQGAAIFAELLPPERGCAPADGGSEKRAR
jgi:Fe-S-cluster containining protein